MRVAMNLTLAASKKEPLAEMVGRIRRAFLEAGAGEPAIRFTLMGEGLAAGHSPIDRVLKRHPEMKRFETFAVHIVGTSETRSLSNSATGEPAEPSTLQAILAGVPRSYPFGAVVIHFHAPVFGQRLIGLPKFGNSLPGVMVTDNRWVTGRHRALAIYTVVEAEEGTKKLPPNPEPVDAVIKACGKVRRTQQVGILAPPDEAGRVRLVGSISPEKEEAVKAIVADYRTRLKEVVAGADLPHNLPPAADARSQNTGVTAGPRKPALEASFKPMGYSCLGGSGQFHLTRRTSGNLTVELYLDVGTWSHQVSAIFHVKGVGFKASLGIPVAPDEAAYGQYPTGDAVQWQKIVENLAAMVRELDRSFVPEIEQAAGPSPAWYQPAS
jgi:hypothetical protein